MYVSEVIPLKIKKRMQKNCGLGMSDLSQFLQRSFWCVTGSLGHLRCQLSCGLCAFEHKLQGKTHAFLTTGTYSLNYWFIASSTHTSHSLRYILEKPNAQNIYLQLKYFSVRVPNPVVEGNWVKSKLSQTSQISHCLLMARDLWAMANCWAC